MSILRKWILLFSDVEVIYYASTVEISSFLEEVKGMGILPKAIGAGLSMNSFTGKSNN